MRFSTISTTATALISSVAAAPYYPFPLADGFPSPSASQLKAIEKAAGGSLPGGSLPATLSATAVATVQLIVLNEIFEVAFFNDVVTNLTHKVAGYTDTGSVDYDYALKTLTAIKNQEELHAAGANAILKTSGHEPIAPCSYNIPVHTFADAIALADTFTSVVLGVLPQAQTVFATDGGDEIPLVTLLGSIIAQEAQQDGWFRSSQKKLASAAPFLTTEGPSFAFTFLTGVIAPGCAGVDIVKKAVPTFPALTVVQAPTSTSDSYVQFAAPGTVTKGTDYVAYITGHNLPVVVPIYDVYSKGGLTYFCAKFPFESDGFSKGLTVAAVVNSKGPFTDISQVPGVTIFGPGIIEVQ